MPRSSKCSLSKACTRISLPDHRQRRLEGVLAEYMAGTRESWYEPAFRGTLLCTHGAYGYGIFHIAACLGDDIIVEFVKTRGVVLTDMTQFIERCILDHRKCPDPDSRDPIVRVYLPCHSYRPLAREYSSFAFPNLSATMEERAEWAMRHVRVEDYSITDVNCEHVARWIVSDRAYSAQMRHISLPKRVAARVLVGSPLSIVAILLLLCVLSHEVRKHLRSITSNPRPAISFRPPKA